jgi:hypothetical protein
MKRQQLRQACSRGWKALKTAANYKESLPNGWTFHCERQYPLPARVGPAWYPAYYLISPTGKRFGGYETGNGFSGYFGNPHGWQWIDDYKANGFKKTQPIEEASEPDALETHASTCRVCAKALFDGGLHGYPLCADGSAIKESQNV